jgi:hypothetical protein
MEQANNINAKQEIYHAKKRCIEQFGFQANPRLSIRQNFSTAIKNENLNTPMLPTNLPSMTLQHRVVSPQIQSSYLV